MKVEFNDESKPKGTEVHVANLGTFVNGKSVELDEEALQRFENATGMTVAEAFKDDERVSLSGAGSRTTSEDAPKDKDGGDK